MERHAYMVRAGAVLLVLLAVVGGLLWWQAQRIAEFERYIDAYAAMAMARGRGVWEDLFVLRHFPQLSRDFRVPPRRIAARFGAEHVDAVAPDLRRGERDLAGLPFGIHGWIQYQPEVWTPYARRFGHDV